MVLVVGTSSNDALYFYGVSSNLLNGFQVIERTRFCDRRQTYRQTDRQTTNGGGGVKICPNGHGPIIKIAVIPIYGKTLKNLLLRNQESLEAES